MHESGSGSRQIFCVDTDVLQRLGPVQRWWCPFCEERLELGSEALAFVSDSDGPAWPVVVHSNCREGAQLRGSLSSPWDALENHDVRNRARQRVEAAREAWYPPEPADPITQMTDLEEAPEATTGPMVD